MGQDRKGKGMTWTGKERKKERNPTHFLNHAIECVADGSRVDALLELEMLVLPRTIGHKLDLSLSRPYRHFPDQIS